MKKRALGPRFEKIEIGLLTEPEKNPNVMPKEQFKLLVEAIKSVGCLQPVLVREAGKSHTYVIIDGVHRTRACREAGLDEIPCIVVYTDDQQAAALQLGMNRLRGELDLGGVARALADLALEGWSVEDMALTGFADDEIADLLKAVSGDDIADVIAEAALASKPDQDDLDPAPGGSFELTLTFESKRDLGHARRALKKAAGDSRNLAAGLLRILGGETED